MQYVIWGAGERGKRIFPHIGEENVDAFIDIDKQKVGKEILGKKIIGFKEYLEKYRSDWIVISCSYEDEVIDILKQNGIYNFFCMSDCPGEFQESYSRDILKNYIINYLKKDRKYAIYGGTLYSVIMCEWIKRELGILVDIIPHQGVSMCLKEQMTGHKFYSLETLSQMDVDEILVTVEQDMDIVCSYKNNNTIATNVYDCSDKIEEYYNPQIEKFKNIHEGKRCFIVATGPSLKMEDLDILAANNEICISVNSIWKAFDSTKWRPQYYLAMDYRVLRDWGDIMEKQRVPYLFLGDTDKDFWRKKHSEKCIKHHLVYEYTTRRHPKFSEDFARKSYMGSTVTYNAIQLAVYMGFKEIYLLGVDFSYFNEPKKEYGHFYKEDKLVSVGFDAQVLLAYEATQKYADINDIKIFNATRGGKLEVFKRVNFDDLF